jgi:molybdate transport system substrate-binding protein
MRRKLRALLVAMTVLAVLGAGASSASAATPKLYVHAAGSLYKAFPALVAPFKAAHPRYKSYRFVFNFQGTDTLVQQIEAGAPADVFAGASTKYGTQLFKDGFIFTPNLFCQNKLCVIVPRSNPANIDSLDDLTQSGVMIAIGDAAVPIGGYTRQILTNITTSGVYGATYSDDVMANVVATVSNVNMVTSLVTLGEVDAGFVFKSDALAANIGKVRVLRVNIPNAYQSSPLPTYPISRVKAATQPAAAKSFINFTLSARGQRILKAYGLLAKPSLLVSAVLPTSGAAGSTVTITGAGFGTTKGTVSIGGSAATTSTWTGKSIEATVPASVAAGAQSVTVTTAAGKTSNAVTFTVTTPSD